MHSVSEGSVIVGAAGSIINAGVVTGVGIDWTTTYEPFVKAVINAGVVTAAGSVVVDVQGSNVLASGYASLGSIAFAGAPAGTQAYSVDVFTPYQYVRVVETVTAGSATMSTTLLGKPRTVTS